MLRVEPANLRQIGRDDRDPHHEILVQLRRIHVQRVLRDAIRHDADVESLHVRRHDVVRPLSEQPHVRAPLERGHVHLRGAHERERRLGHARGHRGDQILIDPLMEPAEIPDDGSSERL